MQEQETTIARTVEMDAATLKASEKDPGSESETGAPLRKASRWLGRLFRFGLEKFFQRAKPRVLATLASGLKAPRKRDLNCTHLLSGSCGCGAAFEKSEQVGVDCAGFGCGHAMREALVGFQCAVLQQFCGERRGVGVRDDLVVVAVHN